MDILRSYLDFEILEEHYYLPILFRKDTGHFQHIIKTESEIDFLSYLKEYLAQENNKLKSYEWWYFSKIDEAVDKIGIPYFDEDKGEYRSFFPDFVFWLKKNGKYYLIFVDPKGVEFTSNSASKIDGFNDFLEDFSKLKDKKFEKISLFYFNAGQPQADVKEEYRKYWTDDFNKIFADMVSDLFFSDVISDDSITEHQKYTEYLPVLTLEAAATAFGKEQQVEPLCWKKNKAGKEFSNDYFIAKVIGKSMEPTIKDGDYCIFRFERGGSRNGLVVLVESRLVSDPETFQKFTVKRYKSEKEDLGDDQWRHKKIILSPDNKEFKDIVLENVAGDDFRVVAEFVEVLVKK